MIIMCFYSLIILILIFVTLKNLIMSPLETMNLRRVQSYNVYVGTYGKKSFNKLVSSFLMFFLAYYLICAAIVNTPFSWYGCAIIIGSNTIFWFTGLSTKTKLTQLDRIIDVVLSFIELFFCYYFFLYLIGVR